MAGARGTDVIDWPSHERELVMYALVLYALRDPAGFDRFYQLMQELTEKGVIRDE